MEKGRQKHVELKEVCIKTEQAANTKMFEVKNDQCSCVLICGVVKYILLSNLQTEARKKNQGI